MTPVDHCPACGNAEPEPWLRLDDDDRLRRFLEFSERKYGGLLSQWLEAVPPEILRCPGCGHHWYRVQPDPDQLAQMYAAGRPLVPVKSVEREPAPHMLARMMRLQRLADRSTGRPTLLDFGSGRGRWSRAAVQAGFAVVSYEPSEARGGEADTPFELVHQLDIVRGRRFDVIELEQVLEHVTDPLGVLETVRSFCHPGTLVHLTVPNLLRDPAGQQVWPSWPFDGRTPHVMAPYEHLHGFTPRSLEAAASRAGFRLAELGARLRFKPVLPLRRAVGRLVPRWGATELLLRPARA